MILPDVNILIYAHNRADPHFERANPWFQTLMVGREPVCFCWETINGFIRVSTNPRAMPTPIPLKTALALTGSWLSDTNTLFLEPTERHFEILEDVALGANAKGPLFSDAILAALAIAHNATIASTDRDFRLFDGLKLIDPLAVGD